MLPWGAGLLLANYLSIHSIPASHHAVNLFFSFLFFFFFCPMDQLSSEMLIGDWSCTVLKNSGRRRLNKLNQTRTLLRREPVHTWCYPFRYAHIPFWFSLIYGVLRTCFHIRHAEEFSPKDRYCWQTRLNHCTAYSVLSTTCWPDATMYRYTSCFNFFLDPILKLLYNSQIIKQTKKGTNLGFNNNV